MPTCWHADMSISYILVWTQIIHFPELFFKMAELVMNCAVQPKCILEGLIDSVHVTSEGLAWVSCLFIRIFCSKKWQYRLVLMLWAHLTHFLPGGRHTIWLPLFSLWKNHIAYRNIMHKGTCPYKWRCP